MDAKRKAYHLIGSVLVERTIGDVVPILESNGGAVRGTPQLVVFFARSPCLVIKLPFCARAADADALRTSRHADQASHNVAQRAVEGCDCRAHCAAGLSGNVLDAFSYSSFLAPIPIRSILRFVSSPRRPSTAFASFRASRPKKSSRSSLRVRPRPRAPPRPPQRRALRRLQHRTLASAIRTF